MVQRRSSGTSLLALALVGLVAACSGAPPTPSAPVAAAPAATPATEYERLQWEFDNVTVPAAKREGEVTWYACGQTDDAEDAAQLFNQAYPEIRVNYVTALGFQLMERITTEVAAGRVQADVYRCSSQSARTLGWRDLATENTPPRALDPSVDYNWRVMDPSGKFAINAVTLSGILVNTRLVPADKYPKTWWDFVRDPYWVDLYRRGLVGTADPRIISFTPYIAYALKDLHTATYGETWIQEFAALKPKIFPTDAGEVARGELAAFVAAVVRQRQLEQRAPILMLCPQPGCVAGESMDVIIKGAPHPNAAKVFVNWWFSKDAQELLARQGRSPARPDVAVDPMIDFKIQPHLYWPEDEHAQNVNRTLEWIQRSKLFDY
jgi:iron(III) transport system substrate-binding protein